MNRPNIKKVLLIFPPTITSMETVHFACPPLGLAYIAAAIRDRYETKILDATVLGYKREVILKGDMVRFGLSVKEIGIYIRDFNPQVVGISCLYSNQFHEVIDICRTTKKIDRRILTVTGGTHPTFLPEDCLEHPELDFVVLGEGENTFKNLLQAVETGTPLNKVSGIAYLENKTFRINKEICYIKDLDSLPCPARDLLPMESYSEINTPMGITLNRRPAASMITSRGCKMVCAFCSSPSFWGGIYRTRSPEGVISEIEHLVKQFGMREIRFHDDYLTGDKKRAMKIFSLIIERKIDISWTVPNGLPVWTLDEELLALMKKSGCYEISIAIESGDERVLKDILNKPVNLNKAEETVRKIRDAGMDVSAFFMIGFPGEKRKQIGNTISFAKKILPDRTSVMIFNPLPGTPITDRLKEKGLIDSTFSFKKNDYCRAPLPLDDISQRELEDIRNRFFIFYNIRIFFRNPVNFIIRYWKIVFTKPALAMDMIHLKTIRLRLKDFFKKQTLKD